MRNIANLGMSIIKRALCSTLCCLLLTLCLFDAAIATVKPLQYIRTGKYIPLDQNSVVSKVPRFFSANVKPEALLLGSSLPMMAVTSYDDPYCHALRSEDLDAVRTYTQAQYLEHLLSSRLGIKSSVFNLTCYACMSSDAWLILSRAVNADRAPKLVLYGIAPRDFVDNCVPEVGKTPVFEVLASWKSLKDILENNHSLESIRDFVISTGWYYYRVKADYKTLASLIACDFFNRPMTLFAATQQLPATAAARSPATTANLPCVPPKTSTPKSIVPAKQAALDLELDTYQKRYNPANAKRFQQESEYFRKLLEICRTNHIKCVIFNMPITNRNRALIPKDIYRRYQQEVCNLPAQYGAHFINLDDSSIFSDEDFLDSVHANAQGGKKIQDLLIAEMSKLSIR